METLSRFLFVFFSVCVVVAALVTALRGPKWWWALARWVRVAVGLTLIVLLATAASIQFRIDGDREPVWADRARTWAAMPLLVRSGIEVQSYRLQLEHAMALWNNEVGCTLFASAEATGPAQVRIVFLRDTPCGSTPVAADPKAAARTYYCPDGTADIEVQSLDDLRVAYVVFGHELGHVLGLAHDRVGLMSEVVTQVDLADATPNRKDVEALRARYCPAVRR